MNIDAKLVVGEIGDHGEYFLNSALEASFHVMAPSPPSMNSRFTQTIIYMAKLASSMRTSKGTHRVDGLKFITEIIP
ncbi:hypothetical protein ABXJ76_06445 [Methylobacter sp. G7]|uniref:hypothetical protein n=1 Tax=Methylobacter sp. G7 TaxID=3230117 RepID=UPI003D801526